MFVALIRPKNNRMGLGGASLATATLKSAIACSRVGGQGDAAKGLSFLATGHLQNVRYWGVKRTCRFALQMSAFALLQSEKNTRVGQKRTSSQRICPNLRVW